MNKKSVRFSKSEDKKLLEHVKKFGQSWSRISLLLAKSRISCHRRYLQLVNEFDTPDSRVIWSLEEDAKLRQYVQTYGPKRWEIIAKDLPNRIGPQCRERWVSILEPNVTGKKPWTSEEEELVLSLFQKYGSRWTVI